MIENMLGDMGTCVGTCLGTWERLGGTCALGESWIWEQGIVIILISMHASITCIMYTSYIQ